MELDLHRLELRFAHLRIVDAPAVQRLANSIEEHGQLVECVRSSYLSTNAFMPASECHAAA
jgi:ParB-like chromosome segregation protein Spo0J